ncbi:MAG: Hsp20/alpha crystallin family protein [Deltaproteobacteria bacterium]|nr:Hsp20/alpha crystallin family protein [Deltaproteobacteria bacterium]
MSEKDLQAREKVEVAGQAESTRNLPLYVPSVDIYESADALTLVADMPGVAAENISIDIKDNQLSLRGNVTLEGENEQVILQEYGVGDFYRQFTLGKAIDQSKIEATMKDGVLVVTLPKAEAVKPRKITVKTG